MSVDVIQNVRNREHRRPCRDVARHLRPGSVIFFEELPAGGGEAGSHLRMEPRMTLRVRDDYVWVGGRGWVGHTDR